MLCLGLLDGTNEACKVRRIDVTDCREFQIAGIEAGYVEACVLRVDGSLCCCLRSLLNEHGDAMRADAVEKLRHRTIVEIGEVSAVEPRVVRKVVREIEAEGKLSLEPGLHGMAIGGDHLGWLICREGGDVQIRDLRDEGCVLDGGAL